MAWYEHQPFYWILKNLTTKQIIILIVGVFLAAFFLGSYYVYLDFIQTIKNNLPVFYLNMGKFAIVFIILIILLLLET